jgi:hypothetical protein
MAIAPAADRSMELLLLGRVDLPKLLLSPAITESAANMEPIEWAGLGMLATPRRPAAPKLWQES